MNWFGPMPGTREARALSSMALTVALIICIISVVRGFQGQTFMGRPLGGDFAQFYAAGKILNQFDASRLYDLDLEVKLQHQAVPATAADQMLVFASAPFLAQILRPFAALPYAWAYVAWLLFSMALYSFGVVLLIRSTALSAQQRITGFLLGISCMPFLLETWIGGQISVIGFFAITLFVFLRARNRKFWAGMALSLALLKPTLVAIPILMLLCGRRWRMLGGAVAGAAALALVSIQTVGIRGCISWLETLQFYGKLTTGPASALRRNKYVDAGSFFHLLLGNASTIAQVLGILAAVAGIAVLGAAWWRSAAWSLASRDLLWAATFAGALVTNVYTPIYDTVLLAPAVALASGVMLHWAGRERNTFAGWLVLLYMVPWLTQSFAEFLRFQPFTLVLAGFAWWTLGIAQRQGNRGVDELQDSTYHQLLGLTSYLGESRTNNSGQRLSVFLRSYSLPQVLLWERDR